MIATWFTSPVLVALSSSAAQIRYGAVKGMRSVTANIDDLNPNCELQQVDAARSPSALNLTTTSATLAGNGVAPGDSQRISYRTAVDGLVESEKITSEVNVSTHCLVDGA